MRTTFCILTLLFVSSTCFCQDSIINSKRLLYSDTTLQAISLADTLILNNLVAVENNKNVVIYISKDSIKSFVQRALSVSNWDKKNCNKILHELHRLKRGKIQDLTKLYSFTLKWIVSEQIRSGNAKIYDKQNHTYLTTLYNRIERVISTGYRTFYFSKTDRRNLFTYAELRGIIPNEFMPDIE
jgi:hypothetical protein